MLSPTATHLQASQSPLELHLSETMLSPPATHLQASQYRMELHLSETMLSTAATHLQASQYWMVLPLSEIMFSTTATHLQASQYRMVLPLSEIMFSTTATECAITISQHVPLFLPCLTIMRSTTFPPIAKCSFLQHCTITGNLQQTGQPTQVKWFLYKGECI